MVGEEEGAIGGGEELLAEAAIEGIDDGSDTLAFANLVAGCVVASEDAAIVGDDIDEIAFIDDHRVVACCPHTVAHNLNIV